MEDVNYPGWVDYIERIFKKHGVKPDRSLICLQNGNITLLLKERGYDVIGIDQSEDMLSVAKEKAVKTVWIPPYISGYEAFRTSWSCRCNYLYL